MKILVTGGAGFIGSHLVESLLDSGHEVVVLDNFSTGNLENLEAVNGHPRLTVIHGSVLDPYIIEKATRGTTAIFHLAAALGVRFVFENPVETIQTNVRGTEYILEAAERGGQKVFIASTSEVYGKDIRNGGQHFRETDDLTFGYSHRWSYAASKALDEFLARGYYRKRGLRIVIGRYFNTVGPRQSPAYGMVIPTLVQQALANAPLTVYGDGQQTRSFTWVGDATKATLGLMEEPRAEGEIFNIGSEEAVTILDLAKKIIAKTNSSSSVSFVPYEEAYGAGFEDIRYRVPSLEKLVEFTGFRPQKNLDFILDSVIDRYQKLKTGKTRKVQHHL